VTHGQADLRERGSELVYSFLVCVLGDEVATEEEFPARPVLGVEPKRSGPQICLRADVRVFPPGRRSSIPPAASGSMFCRASEPGTVWGRFGDGFGLPAGSHPREERLT
jgi:hypothetical protein